MSTLAMARWQPSSLPQRRLPASLFAASICIAFGLAVTRPAIDPDLGWHLRTGRLILEAHAIPKADPYSFTAFGAPWVEQEWLWQVLMAAIDALFGTFGVILVNSLIATSAIAFVYLILREREVGPKFAALGAAIAMMLFAPHVGPRPATAGAPLAAVFLLAFEKYRRTANWRWLAALVPLQVVWANLHESYLAGLLLCAIYAAASLWQTQRLGSLLPWGTLFAGLTAASLANPLGLNLPRFALTASHLPFNREHVVEWLAPDFANPSFAPLLACLVGSLVLGCLYRGWGAKKPQLLLLAVCTALALQTQQFGALYAVAAAPILAEILYEQLGRPNGQTMSLGVGASLLVAIVGLAALLPARTLAPQPYQAAVDRALPVQAVSFIERHDLPGPIWNDYDWGGYLIDALPRLPVFVDGRSELYGQAFLSQYWDVAWGTTPPDKLFDRYGIRLALIKSGSPLATELRQRANWRQAYRDELASVFVLGGNEANDDSFSATPQRASAPVSSRSRPGACDFQAGMTMAGCQ